MKIDFKQMLLVGALWLFSIIILLWLFGSCSSSHHLNKFYKKGGTLNCDTTMIYKLDTIIKNGDTIVLERPHTIIEKQIEYKTRWQTRYAYKHSVDTLRLIEWKTKIEYKQAITESKNKKKRGFAYNFRLLLVIAGLILLIILLFRFKK